MKAKWPYLLSFLLDNKFIVLATFFAGLFSNIFTVLIPISIGKYYNIVFYFDTTKSAVLDFLPDYFWIDFTNFMIFFIGIVLIKMVLMFVEKFLTGMLGERLVYRIRNDLFDHQLHMSMSEYDQKGIGRYLLRYSGDLKSVQSYMTQGVIRFASDTVLIGFSIGVLLLIDFWLFLILIGFVTGILFIMNVFNNRLYDISLLRRGSKSGLLSFVNSGLRAILTVKIFNKIRFMRRKYFRKSEKVYKLGIRYQFLSAVINSVIPSLLFFMLAMILVYVYYQKMHGGPVIDGGTLLASVLILITMLPVLRRTIRVTSKWKIGNLSIQKLLITFHKPVEHGKDLPDLDFKDGNIKITDIKFGYTAERNIFDGLNLEIPAQKLCLIKGKVGDGKSTLLKLLTAVYLPDEGSIEIDGQDISQVNPNSLRRNIAVVSPHLPFVGRTVFDAISRNRKEASEKHAKKVLQTIQEHLSEDMHLSLDSQIGDLGDNLSIGQKQLLAFARAILTKKKIILVDEPFHGLDIKSAEKIALLLRKIKTDQTIIMFTAQEFSNFGDVWQILDVDHEYDLGELQQKKAAEQKDKVEEKPKELQYENIEYTDRKGRKVFEELSLSFPVGKMSLITVQDRRDRRMVRRLIAGEITPQKGEIIFGGKPLPEAQEMLKSMIATAGANQTFEEKRLIDVLTGGKESKVEKAEKVLENLQRNLDDSEKVKGRDRMEKLQSKWTRTQEMMVTYMRAYISGKPILILEQPFDKLDERTIMEFSRLLRKLKGSRTIILINEGELPVGQDVQFILDIDNELKVSSAISADGNTAKVEPTPKKEEKPPVEKKEPKAKEPKKEVEEPVEKTKKRDKKSEKKSESKKEKSAKPRKEKIKTTKDPKSDVA